MTRDPVFVGYAIGCCLFAVVVAFTDYGLVSFILAWAAEYYLRIAED